MLEYISFNIQTHNLFMEAVISSGISPVSDCEAEYFSVKLAGDSNEDALKKLEEYYDELMDSQRTLAEQSQADSADDIHAAGVTIRLKNGHK